MTWRMFIRAHWPALLAADFFTTGVWTLRGLRTYDTAFVIERHSRRVQIFGSTPYPDDAFVVQAFRGLMGREVLGAGRVLICDRDPKWSRAMEVLLTDVGVRVIRAPPAAPHCNAHAERFVRSIKAESSIASCRSASDTFATCFESSSRTITGNGITRVSRTNLSSGHRFTGWVAPFTGASGWAAFSATTTSRRRRSPSGDGTLRGRARGRHGEARQHPHRGGDQPAALGSGRKGALPRRPLLPPERRRDPRATAAGTARRRDQAHPRVAEQYCQMFTTLYGSRP